jgi:hypothetical protein
VVYFEISTGYTQGEHKMAGRYKRGWTEQHQQVFKLNMSGLPPREIAEKTGIPIARIYEIMRTKKFVKHEEQIVGTAVEKVRHMLEGRLEMAANKIVEIMKSGKPEERLRFDAAKEILYQCGMKPVEVVETRTRAYTPEEIKSSLAVIKEVKEIEATLSTQGSGFLIKQDESEAPPTLAPVTADIATPATEEVPLSV